MEQKKMYSLDTVSECIRTKKKRNNNCGTKNCTKCLYCGKCRDIFFFNIKKRIQADKICENLKIISGERQKDNRERLEVNVDIGTWK